MKHSKGYISEAEHEPHSR
ncbi:hypothetical protein [Cronobacter sakazakii]